MHDFPCQKLCELIDHHGTILSEDVERCESLLHRVCGDKYKREVFVLVNAIKEDVVKDLLNSPQHLPNEMLNRLAQRLYNNLWLDKTAAEWAVQSWAIALNGKTTEPITQKKSLQLLTTDAQEIATVKVKKPPKRLSSFNLLDYLRLLWWVLVKPQQLQAYRQTFGQEDEKRVGNWLVSSLIWWPLLIPTLALGLEQWPHVAEAWLPNTYLLISAFLIIGWLLTGGIKINKDMAIGITIFISVGIAVGVAVDMAGIVIGVVAIWFPVAIVVSMALFVAVIIASLVAIIVASDVAVVIAVLVSLGVAVGIAGGVTLWLSDFIVGFIACSIAGFVAGVVVNFMANFMGNATKESLKTGKYFFLARLVFLFLVISHFLLFGLYFVDLNI